MTRSMILERCCGGRRMPIVDRRGFVYYDDLVFDDPDAGDVMSSIAGDELFKWCVHLSIHGNDGIFHHHHDGRFAEIYLFREAAANGVLKRQVMLKN